MNFYMFVGWTVYYWFDTFASLHVWLPTAPSILLGVGR